MIEFKYKQFKDDIEHRKVKYLNNIIEQDHGKLKRLIKPMLGFKSMKTAHATITGYEWMRMFKKGQFDIWTKTERKDKNPNQTLVKL